MTGVTRGRRSCNAGPIRILHVIESLARGGAERQLVDLLTRTDREQFEHVVCTLFAGNDLAPELEAAGIDIVRLAIRSRRSAWAAMRAIYEVVCARRPNIVHTWLYAADIYGRTAASAAQVPIVISAVQNSWYESAIPSEGRQARIKSWLIRQLDGWTARACCRRMIASSEFCKQSTATQLGFPEERIETIYNAVDVDRFAARDGKRVAELRVELRLEGCTPVLLCLARLVPPKGHRYLLEALPIVLRDCPKARLLVAGDGPEADVLRAQAKALGLEHAVQFLGRRPDAIHLLHASDLFVFPSVCAEGLPVAMAEAMAAGKPCIAWDVPPNREIIESGRSGILVSARDVPGLARAICCVATDPALAVDMGTKAQAIARIKFNLRHAVKALEDLYTAEVESTTNTIRPPSLSPASANVSEVR